VRQQILVNLFGAAVFKERMRNWSDEQLIEKLRSPEAGVACRALYDRYSGPLLRFLYRFTGNQEGAEEILHDIFLELVKGNFRDFSDGGFKSWLFTVARNRGLNSTRHAARERPESDLEETAGPEDVESATDLRLALRRLESAESRLPRDLLDTWRLRRSGLAYEEIAAELAIPLGTVKSRFHRLVEFLKEDWKK
jgi:RNA polymerase sigma-70 factor (ECF subfamily)